ncbi:MAG: hypothetical protein U0973_11610 [Xanthomonadaceae bacterium]|nr:hypothetical protein [Xanthomonadaceae bacterium]
MNAMNSHYRTALQRALAALLHLEMRGCTVIGMQVDGPRPVLQLDSVPGGFVTGALKRRSLDGAGIARVMAAPFLDCQIEWTERNGVAKGVRR